MTKKVLYTIATILIVTLAMTSNTVRAVSAYPYPISVTQPDGTTITVRIHGDEYFNYTTTSDGYPVVRKSDGYYYYASYTMQGIQTTTTKAHNPATRTFVDKSIVGTLQRVDPSMAALYRSQSQIFQTNQDQLQNNATRSTATKASKPSAYMTKPLVILVSYTDVVFKTTNAQQVFKDFLNKKGTAPLGSVRDYWRDNSMGAYDPEYAVYGPVTLSKKRSYYGENGTNGHDKLPYMMTVEACQIVANQGVDLKTYDQNNDGILDNVVIIFAGNNEAEGAPVETVWPHQSDISSLNQKVSGVLLGKYACISEFKGASGDNRPGIGTFTHEFGHILGLMDLYDTDYEVGGQANGLGSLSLMANGNYNNDGNSPPYLNIFEREMLAWATITELKTGNITLEPVQTSNTGYFINTSSIGEQFVIENRLSSGWDKYISMMESVRGMIIYHVDQSSNDAGGTTAFQRWIENTPNAYAAHECMKLITADGKASSFMSSSMFFPGSTGNQTFNYTSTPSSKDWNNKSLELELSQITQLDNNNVTLNAAKAEERYSVAGKITSDIGPIKGAIIKLIPKNTIANLTKNRPLGFFDIRNLTKAAGEIVATSNSVGQFTLTGVTSGEYSLTVAIYGYMSHIQPVTVESRNLTLNPITLTKTDVALQTAVSQSNGVVFGFLSGAIKGVKNMWTPQMIAEKTMTGDPIKYLTWYTGLDNVKATASVLFNNDVKFSTDFVTQSGNNIIPVDLPLTVPADKTLSVQFTFAPAAGLIAALDNGPTVKGFGDLILFNDKWQPLSDYNITGNIVVSYWKDKNSAILDAPQMVIKALGQRHVIITWGSTDGNIDSWEITATGEGVDQKNETKKNEMTFFGLQPGKPYQINIIPVFQGTKGTPKTQTITTPALSAPFPAIAIPQESAIAARETTCSLVNLPSMPEKIRWSFNGAAQVDSFAVNIRPNIGKNILTVTVTYADGKSEILTRSFNAAEAQ